MLAQTLADPETNSALKNICSSYGNLDSSKSAHFHMYMFPRIVRPTELEGRGKEVGEKGGGGEREWGFSFLKTHKN